MRGRASGAWRAVFALTVTAALGCEEDPPATPKGIVAVYDAPEKTILAPYPSDRYTVSAATATGRRLDIAHTGSTDLIAAPASAATAAELDQMDGFSTTGGVIVSFDGPIDLASIERADAEDFTALGSPLWLVDVDDASPDKGRAIGIVPRWWETPQDDYYLTAEYTLLAQPAVPLRPRTRYALAVTDALKAADGGEVHRSPMMADLLEGRATGAYADEVKAALTVLAGVGVATEHVVLATVFTTASVRDGLASIAAQNRAKPAPAMMEPWAIETPADATGRARYRGVYAAPEWRTPLPDGRFVLDAMGAPMAQATVGLEAFLAFSDATKSGPRPVVVFGHGLGGDKDGVSGTAQRLAALDPAGVAVFGIDSPWHGARSQGADSGTAIFRFFGIDPKDATFVLGRARDNFRQMASDQLELVRLIGSLGALDLLPEGAPDGIPDLDVSRILYIGHSFGSVQGPTVFALAPELEAAVWNVGGSNMTMLLRDSNTFSLLVNGLRPPATPDGAVARFFAIAQGIIDPGDSLNYARYAGLEPFPGAGMEAWKPRDVLLQEVIDDSIVPNSTSEMLARAAGLENANALRHISGVKDVTAPVVANLPTGATGVISQFDVIEGTVPATHGELIFAPEGQAQYVEFFRTVLEEGRGRVLPQYP